jgi:hypothetical protein
VPKYSNRRFEMVKKRALKDAATDPVAEKELPQPGSNPGVAVIALTMGVGILVGLIGGLFSKRLLKIFF